MGCFKYSPVAGAAANELPNPVAEEVKEARWEQFMATQQKISNAKLAAKIGQRLEVLIDSVDESGAVGRSKGDAPEIDGVVHLPGANSLNPGDWVTGNVTAADDYDLWLG